MVNVPIFDTITGLFTGKTKILSSPSAANTRSPGTTYASEYPYNYTQVTRAGHEIQLDDTPGNERMRFAHKSGSYTEVSQDGRKVEVVTANDSKIVKQSTTITIEKNGDIKIGGAARIVVGGDAHLEVKGNMTQTIGGSYNLVVKKDYNILCEGRIGSQSGKDSSFIANENMFSIGKVNFVAGALAGNTTIKSKDLLLIESLNGDIQAQAAENIIIYGENRATLFSNKEQTKVISKLGSTYIHGNTFIAIRSAGSDPAITVAQLEAGATPPMGGELKISGKFIDTFANTISTHAISWNAWDTYGVGYVYTNNHIYTYTNGVTSTSSVKQPPKVPTP
jgi:hypothetical protein